VFCFDSSTVLVRNVSLVYYCNVLSHIEPPALRRKAAVDGLVAKSTVYRAWRPNNDLLHPPQHRLTLHTPLWSDMEPVVIISQWHHDWSSASVVNCDLVQDPTIHPPGFGLPRIQWRTLKSKSLQNKPRTLWRLP